MPGAARQTWYCSVAFCWKTSEGGGGATSSLRAAGLRAGGAGAFPASRPTSSTRRAWSALPAAATTTLSARYRLRWNAPSDRREIEAMTSADPITGRPSGWFPKTACVTTSKMSSWGESSTMAISSSTTSRSASRSARLGAKTMSVMMSSAVSTCSSRTRA
jgi:hypothetical protein